MLAMVPVAAWLVVRIPSKSRGSGYLVSLLWPTVLGIWNAITHPVNQKSGEFTGQSDWLTGLGEPFRATLKLHAVGISRDAVALALGITDGDTSLLTDNLKQQFKLLSLTHLTAVSGTNCAILVAATSIALSWLGARRRIRVVISLLVLASYLVLVGNQPSVIRAAIMSTVVLVSLNYGQRIPTVNVLALAVVIALALEPDFAGNLGFQLSVAATAGVVLLAPRLAVKFERLLPKALALLVAVAVSAQVCCLPILITLQSNIGAGAILANILAEPAVPPATILGLIAAIFSLVHIAPMSAVASGFFAIATLPAAYLVSLSNWLVAALPTFPLPAGSLGMFWVLLLLAFSLLWVSKAMHAKRVRLVVGLLLVGTLLFSQLGRLPRGQFAPHGWVMVACDVGQGDATVIRANDSVALIDTGKDSVKIASCLNRLGVRRIALLELTHFDLDHVGAVAQVVSTHQIDEALLTQFPDVRPGAVAVERILHRAHIPARKVALGDTGVLGDPKATGAFSWLVLTPHVGGAGSSSSNDGSISMFWHSKAVNIFTMADLPASGQQRVMMEMPMWWTETYRQAPTVLKVSHHGSADQDPDFLSWVHPALSTISVGVGNDYGHPTQKALDWLRTYSNETLRTDLLGSISITPEPNQSLGWGNTGAG